MSTLEANLESNSGNKGRMSISEKDELIDLRTKQTILEYLEPMSNKLDKTYEMALLIDQKVQIHNNYENRIRNLERNQWRVVGIYTVVVAIIFFLISKL